MFFIFKAPSINLLNNFYSLFWKGRGDINALTRSHVTDCDVMFYEIHHIFVKLNFCHINSTEILKMYSNSNIFM